MIDEIREFLNATLVEKRRWLDGEFVLAVAIGIGFGVGSAYYPSLMDASRSHFGDLISASSIVFGFVLTTLFFYIQAASAWSRDKKVSAVAKMLIDDHVWGVCTLLVLLGYILALWVIDWTGFLDFPQRPIAYGILAFFVAFAGFQVLNHTLTIRWVFLKRDRFILAPKIEIESSGTQKSTDLNDKEITETDSE